MQEPIKFDGLLVNVNDDDDNDVDDSDGDGDEVISSYIRCKC